MRFSKASRPVSWNCIRRKRRSLTAVMINGRERIRSRNSISLAIRFGQGKSRARMETSLLVSIPGSVRSLRRPRAEYGTSIRQVMLGWQLHHRSDLSLEEIARMVNPSLRGWINYYGTYYRTALYRAIDHFDSDLTARE